MIIDPKTYQSTHFLNTVENSLMDLAKESQTSKFEESVEVRNNANSESLPKVQGQENLTFQIYVTFLHQFSNYTVYITMICSAMLLIHFSFFW